MKGSEMADPKNFVADVNATVKKLKAQVEKELSTLRKEASRIEKEIEHLAGEDKRLGERLKVSGGLTSSTKSRAAKKTAPAKRKPGKRKTSSKRLSSDERDKQVLTAIDSTPLKAATKDGLVKAIGASEPTLNQALTRLKKDGKITDKPSKDDKRVKQFEITKKGREAIGWKSS